MELGILQTVIFEGNGRTGAGTSARDGKVRAVPVSPRVHEVSWRGPRPRPLVCKGVV